MSRSVFRAPEALAFGRFVLDPGECRLFDGDDPVHLRRKSFDTLLFLVLRAGRLVAHDELIAGVWQGVHVSRDTIVTTIRELRRVLDDTARSPSFLETVHGRGYRFIAPVSCGGRPYIAMATTDASEGVFVGREMLVNRLLDEHARASAGSRSAVLVAGPGGIGKSTLVSRATDGIRKVHEVPVGFGRCIESYGASEPYLPLLQALHSLADGADHETVVRVLRRRAPSWFAELPALHPTSDASARDRRPTAATGASRMIREFLDCLDVLQRQIPVVLVVEDLQWIDPSSMTALGALSRQPATSRLTLLYTLRRGVLDPGGDLIDPVRIAAALGASLIDLEPLTREDVCAYLDQRFRGHGFPPEFAGILAHETGGNPLFLINAMRSLIGAGAILSAAGGWVLADELENVRKSIPDSLAETLQAMLTRLDPLQRRVAAAASVIGQSFSSDTVAAMTDLEIPETESAFVALAETGCLRIRDEHRWPDGTCAAHYEFAHHAFQAQLYGTLLPAERQQMHRRAAQRLEVALQGATQLHAAELAFHCERGGEIRRAAEWLYQAAMRSAWVGSSGEALDHLGAAASLLAPLTAEPRRADAVLRVATARASLLTFTRGYDAPEAEALFAELDGWTQTTGDLALRVPALAVCLLYALWRKDFVRIDAIESQFAAILNLTDDPTILLQVHRTLGVVGAVRGRFSRALGHVEQVIRTYDDAWTRELTFGYQLDLAVDSMLFRAVCQLMLGRPDAAVETIETALGHARALDHPASIAFAMHVRSAILHGRCEWDAAIESGKEHVEFAAENDLEFSRLEGDGLLRWAQVEKGERTDAVESLSLSAGSGDPTGATLYGPYFISRLALHFGKMGFHAGGLAIVDPTIAEWERQGGHGALSELRRVRARLVAAAGGDPAEVEGELRTAIAIAAGQDANLFALRAATDLAPRLASTGRSVEARALLLSRLDPIRGGESTEDVRAARTLVDTLA